MSHALQIWALPRGWAPPARLEEAVAQAVAVARLAPATDPRWDALAQVLRARYPQDGGAWSDDRLEHPADGPAWRLAPADGAQREAVRIVVLVEAARHGLYALDADGGVLLGPDGIVLARDLAAARCLPGLCALQQGDGATARRRLAPLAAAGNETALAALSTMYLDGRGVPRDLVVACALACLAAGCRTAPCAEPAAAHPRLGDALRLRARLGSAVAGAADALLPAWSVAGALLPGIDALEAELDARVEAAAAHPVAEALALLEPLAQRGHRRAQHRLARLHAADPVSPRDLLRELAWTQRAADAGEPAARHDMGRLCEEGLLVAADRAEAARWYREALAGGVAEAAAALRRLEAAPPQAAAAPLPDDPVAWEAVLDAADQGDGAAFARLAHGAAAGAFGPVDAVLVHALRVLARRHGAGAAVDDEPAARAPAIDDRDRLAVRQALARHAQVGAVRSLVAGRRALAGPRPPARGRGRLGRSFRDAPAARPAAVALEAAALRAASQRRRRTVVRALPLLLASIAAGIVALPSLAGAPPAASGALWLAASLLGAAGVVPIARANGQRTAQVVASGIAMFLPIGGPVFAALVVSRCWHLARS